MANVLNNDEASAGSPDPGDSGGASASSEQSGDVNLTGVRDLDLQTLETFLDGELPEDEAMVLRRRLVLEPAMQAALEQLQSERAVRQLLFRSLEPQTNQADQLVASVHSAMVAHERWRWINRSLRYVSAAAACVVVGFFAGRVHQGAVGGNTAVNSPASSGNSSVVASNNNNAGNPVSPDGTVPLTFASRAIGPIATDRPDVVLVNLVDDQGRVVGVKHFGSTDAAQEFADDLNHWQQPQRAVASPGGDGQLRLVADHF